jgi:hypothetical protein
MIVKVTPSRVACARYCGEVQRVLPTVADMTPDRYRLSKLSISSFKSIHASCTITLPLRSHMVAIVGSNGAGKGYLLCQLLHNALFRYFLFSF